MPPKRAAIARLGLAVAGVAVCTAVAAGGASSGPGSGAAGGGGSGAGGASRRIGTGNRIRCRRLLGTGRQCRGRLRLRGRVGLGRCGARLVRAEWVSVAPGFLAEPAAVALLPARRAPHQPWRRPRRRRAIEQNIARTSWLTSQDRAIGRSGDGTAGGDASDEIEESALHCPSHERPRLHVDRRQ